MNGKTTTGVVVVTLPKEIDIAASTAGAADLLSVMGDPDLHATGEPGVVIADMTGTTLCDSSGLAMLMYVTRYARARHLALRIVIPPGSAVMRPLVILGMEKALPVYPSFHAAAAALD